MGPIGGLFVAGAPPFQSLEERDAFRRQQRLAIATRAKWELLERDDVVFQRRWVEHRPTGRKFKVSHGLLDAQHTPVTAYLLTEDGDDVVALEELRSTPTRRTAATA
jgi:hypothetical protein